ncbi:MAG TPA: BTAD domain-containing putative transcriptional regulator [Candidatus Dormibacteraeota bacterium]|nr:BTAD domain-containing putative transcriptional regulator [Candidatus Dormibacteraeota bacterium]
MTPVSLVGDDARARVAVRLLGPVEVVVDGSPLVVDTRKALAILAYLVVTRRPAGRETLAALLWPEADPPDARGALRRTLSVLRAGLGESTLVVDRSMVALREPDIDVDLWRFRESLASVRGHEHPATDACHRCLDALEIAAALDRGPFLDGFTLRDAEPFDEWQLAETESHRRDLAAVLERLARGHAAARAWERAVSAARRWLELDPLHEPAHRRLMESLARSGEPAAAVAQYRECVRILDRELGVAPLSETSDLADAIRSGRLGQESAAVREPGLRASVRSRGSARVPPLVGRAAELAAIDAVIRETGSAGRLVVIEGEPGIGKTRLLGAAVRMTRDAGGRAIEGRALGGESGIPFSAVVDLLRGALAFAEGRERLAGMPAEHRRELARLLPVPGSARSAAGRHENGDPFGRVRLFQAVAAALVELVRGPDPGLVAIDDLHLADASSIELVGYIARRPADHPVVLALAWRREELPEGLRERLLAPAMADGRATVVELGRFGRDEVLELAGALGRSDRQAAEALFVESEGLPLYVVEALAAPAGVAGAMPRGVQALLRARVTAAGEIARQVLGAAAVIGRSFDERLARAASGRSDDETVAGLDELVRRGIVREASAPDGGMIVYDFTHGQLREVVHDDLSLARRRLLHGRVADALRSDPSIVADERTRWSLIAHHETLAGGSASAAEAHRRAGDEARAVFANDEARLHLEAALALGAADVAGLHLDLGDVLALLGDYRGAMEHLEAAAALVDADRAAAAELRLGRVYARRGAWDLADGHLAAALEAVDPADLVLRAAILADRSAVTLRRSGPDAATAMALEALAVAEKAEDGAGIARAEDVLGILARRRGELAIARVHLERALAVADPIDRAGLRVAALNTLALVHADAGEHASAVGLTREALGLCERLGDRHRQAALESNLADLLHAEGREAESREHQRRAVTLFAEIARTQDELEPGIWQLAEW